MSKPSQGSQLPEQSPQVTDSGLVWVGRDLKAALVPDPHQEQRHFHKKLLPSQVGWSQDPLFLKTGFNQCDFP